MAITRRQLHAKGSWQVATYSDLASLKAEHGDEAYTEDTGQWYKYDQYAAVWRIVNTAIPEA